MARVGRKNKRADAWVDHLAEAPRADLPEDKARRRARWTRRYVWAAVVLLVPSLLFNAVIVYGNVTPDSEDQETGISTGVMDPLVLEARAIATTTVNRWLAADPSPLPGGQLLSWNYAEDVEALAPVPTNNDGQEVPWDRIVVHDMTVTDGTTMFSARLSTSVDPTEGVHVVGTPSLVPYAPAASSGFSGPVWPGAQSVTTTEAVSESITQWARAFTSGDPSTLRLAVGDPNPDHSYMPLVGAELEGVNVVATTVQQHMLDDDGRPPVDPEQVVARVELTLSWEQHEDSETNTNAQPVTYDVLVDQADTASPNIVAWGGPGQGPVLAPYANAVAGRSLQVVETDTDSDAAGVQGEEGLAEQEDQDSGASDDDDDQDEGQED